MHDADSNHNRPSRARSAAGIHKPPRRPGRRLRVDLEHLVQEATPVQRQALRGVFVRAIRHFLRIERAVYLDGLGILAPKLVDAARAAHSATLSFVRTERRITVFFEKCSDLSGAVRSQFGEPAEIKDLAAWIYPRLPMRISCRWDLPKVRRLLKAMIKVIRHDVVLGGFSAALAPLGNLYALHNRQGRSMRDWYAGADIFIRSRFNEPVRVLGSVCYPRPVLQTAWEPFAAMHGAPLTVLAIDLCRELAKLGYDLEPGAAGDPFPAALKAAVFEKQTAADRSVLLYVTDGLRSIAPSDATALCRTECVFQLAVSPHDFRARPQDLPLWPTRVMALGWILLKASKRGVLSPGAGLDCGQSLHAEAGSELTFILAAALAGFAAPFHTAQGVFRYINLVGITKDEAALLRDFSAARLTALLKHRGCDQITRITRSSVLAKSGWLRARPLSGTAPAPQVCTDSYGKDCACGGMCPGLS